MEKFDIKAAYRRGLLGLVWEDLLYVDAALPFGLRSAPMI